MSYRTYTQIESILRTVFDVDGKSIKEVAEATDIKVNTLYKWNSGAMRFSPDNIDKLLVYFQTYEPKRLARAELIYDTWHYIDTHVFQCADSDTTE